MDFKKGEPWNQNWISVEVGAHNHHRTMDVFSGGCKLLWNLCFPSYHIMCMSASASYRLLQAAPAMARMPQQAAAISGDRDMANVKALRLRLASVKSIQRITKTMKMVAAAKLKGFQTRMMEVC